MALLDSKQLNPKLTGSFILSGSTQTFIGASVFSGSADITGSVNVSGNISGSITSTGSFGYLNVEGDSVIAGNLTFGDADSDSVSFGADISSSLIPDVSNAYNIGSDGKRWNDFYLSGSVSASGGPHHIISATTIDLDAEGALTLDGGSITIGGDTDVAVDLDSSTLDIDASGALTIDSATSISIGTTADKPIDIDSTTLDIDASGAITIDGSSTILISGDGGATFSDDTEALVYDGSGNVDFDTVALDIDSSGAITIDGTSTFSVDVDGATNINTSVGNIGIDSEAGSISIDGHTGVEVTSTNSGVVTIDGKAGVTIQEDGTDVIAIDTNRDVLFSQTGGSTTDPDVEFDGYTRFDGTTEITDATNSTSTSTGALIVDGGVGIVKDLTVGGKITAEEFHTEFVSASIVFSSGSTKFGDTFDDIHQFTGSILIGSTGENTLVDSGSISGSSVSTGSFGRLELAGNLSAESTATASFGQIESTTHIATTVESATFACFGLISGSAISTGSFGRVLIDGGNTQAFIIDNAKVSGSSITTGSFGRLETTQANASFGGKILTLAGNLTTATGPGTIDFAAEKTLTLNENLTVSDGQDVVLTATGQTNTITLAESFNIGDGHTGTLTFSAASKTLTVENTSVVNQDLTSDANPTFAGGTLGNIQVGVTADGEIDTSSGNLTLDSAGGTVEITDDVNITGHVTASGNISSSASIIANDFSGSSVSTGSFGSLRISSPQTLTIDNIGTVSGSSISTGSFGSLRVDSPQALTIDNIGTVSGSSISTGSFGNVNVAGMSIPSVSEFSSSVETRLETLSADVIALSIALG
jgi:hypothetical protein